MFTRTEKALLAIAAARFAADFETTHPNTAAYAGELMGVLLDDADLTADDAVAVIDQLG